jgi:hypothetical protein
MEGALEKREKVVVGTDSRVMFVEGVAAAGQIIKMVFLRRWVVSDRPLEK